MALPTTANPTRFPKCRTWWAPSARIENPEPRIAPGNFPHARISNPQFSIRNFQSLRAPRFLPLVLITVLLILQTACVSRPRYRTPPPPDQPRTRTEKPDGKTPPAKTKTPDEISAPVSTRGAYQVGLASYYAHKFHGRPTASGEIFDMNGLSAAHRELPLGTFIRVTHMGNGRSLELKVNDRGPFVEGRILDLSLGAARRLGMIEEGVAEVKIEIIRPVD